MTHDPLFLVSVNLLVAFIARCWRRNLLTAVLLAVVIIGSGGYLGTHHDTEIVAALNAGRDVALKWTGRTPHWPPVLNQPFPDLDFIDQDGNPVRLSDFKGKVILLEPIGMSCPACVAFSGGNELPSFGGIAPQKNLESIDHYLRRFGNVQPDDPRIVFVQLVLFNQALQTPTSDEVRGWADFFGFRREKQQYVLAGTPNTASQASLDLIPGFQLIDKQGILRYDSTGHTPRHDLYTELLPRLHDLLEE